MQMDRTQIEKHPLKPFLPPQASILMLGSFPPSQKRWSMEFFYPNFQNDMWRIMGLIFYQDKEHFIVKAEKRFDKEKVEQFCTEKGIALFDTAQAVYRTMGTASDKDLEIVEPTDIASLLNQLPHCHTIVSTGQKSAEVLCELFACKMPKMGESCTVNYQQKTLQFYRMPSSSRAYPLQLEKKAEMYRKLFEPYA